eukprot:scaffold5075_cov72-Phaeocystis_antarctica.AAC.2
MFGSSGAAGAAPSRKGAFWRVAWQKAPQSAAPLTARAAAAASEVASAVAVSRRCMPCVASSITLCTSSEAWASLASAASHASCASTRAAPRTSSSSCAHACHGK